MQLDTTDLPNSSREETLVGSSKKMVEEKKSLTSLQFSQTPELLDNNH